jgi:flagellar basal-body rod protein FlgB
MSVPRGLAARAFPAGEQGRRTSAMLKEMLFGYAPDRLLAKMLDKSALEQRVISSNVANAGTPGYERLEVSFDEALKTAMHAAKTHLVRTNPLHLPAPDSIEGVTPEVVKVDDGYWNGINNVNIDTEMADLAKNQLDFDIAQRLLTSRFTGLKMAITGRT